MIVFYLFLALWGVIGGVVGLNVLSRTAEYNNKQASLFVFVCGPFAWFALAFFTAYTTLHEWLGD